MEKGLIKALNILTVDDVVQILGKVGFRVIIVDFILFTASHLDVLITFITRQIVHRGVKTHFSSFMRCVIFTNNVVRLTLNRSSLRSRNVKILSFFTPGTDFENSGN